MDQLVLRAGAATSAGHRRARNEDAYVVTPAACLVADGMGGHAAGDVAAGIAVRTVVSHLDHPDTDVDAVVGSVLHADRAVRSAALATPDANGMGATLVGAAVVGTPSGPAVAIVHVGDARCYRWYDGVLDLVTRDHTLVRELVDAGGLDAHGARTHPMANVVTRAIGAGDPTPDVTVVPPHPARLLLCSDGLSDELPARVIGRVLAGYPHPQAAADRLIELVLAGPARDNATAVVVDVLTVAGSRAMLDTRSPLDHHGADRSPSRVALAS